MSTNGLFSNRDVPTISQKVEEVNSLINTIRRLSPISLWDLSKETKISHSKLQYLLRDLEFARVIFSKVETNAKNRIVRVIYIREANDEKEE